MMRTIDRASRAPMVILKILMLRRLPRMRWTAAPNANHRKQLGNAARTNSPPREAACMTALPASALRKVPAAAALTSQAFGLTHWKAAAPRNPTGFRSGRESMPPDEVAIFHDSQSKKAAPLPLSVQSRNGCWRMRLPSPNGTINIMRPMPVITPSRLGRPRRIPPCAPTAVSIVLLGPGVTAATMAKRRNATARCIIIRYSMDREALLTEADDAL